MTPEERKDSNLKTNAEIFKLNPCSIIYLFEIDLTTLAFEQGIIENVTSVPAFVHREGGEPGRTGSSGINGSFATRNHPENHTVYRFHNSINITRSHIYWRGNKYFAAPITAEGFDINSRGTLPTPTLSIVVDDSSVEILALLKQHIKRLNGLVGAKVNRIKTLSKHIDIENFIDKEAPLNFEADPNVELSRDIFYVDRKLAENKYRLDLQLASLLDVEGVSIPSRLVHGTRCPWKYRGYGCNYEYISRINSSIHGKKAILPPLAPPVANINNESIVDLLNGANIVDRGEWDRNIIYNKGETVYLEKNGIKYYFVAKEDNVVGSPPDLRYWLSDQCAKDITACTLRYKNISNYLPFGGFPGVGRAR
jgi:lambda family phage minor tail protein L